LCQQGSDSNLESGTPKYETELTMARFLAVRALLQPERHPGNDKGVFSFEGKFSYL
jgi:hypothetical protein